MTSAPVRDQLADHLITPQNAALLLIDYQPAQVASVRSMDHELLIKNAVSTVRTIKAFGVPVVHSTVNVAAGQGPDDPGTRRTARGRQAAGPDLGELLGRHRVPRGRAGDRPPEADLLCALDRGLHGVYRARRAARRLRGVPGCRRDRRDFASSPPRRSGPGDPGAAGSRSAGCHWRASCSATGLARRPSPTSWRSSSPTGCGRSRQPTWSRPARTTGRKPATPSGWRTRATTCAAPTRCWPG